MLSPEGEMVQLEHVSVEHLGPQGAYLRTTLLFIYISPVLLQTPGAGLGVPVIETSVATGVSSATETHQHPGLTGTIFI